MSSTIRARCMEKASRHDHDWTRGKAQLGSTQPEGKVVRQSRGEIQHSTFSQLTQPVPKQICDRSGKPEDTEDVFVVKGETSRSHEINERCFHEELCSSDRSRKPDSLSEKTVLSKLTMEEGNLMSVRAQVHTQ